MAYIPPPLSPSSLPTTPKRLTAGGHRRKWTMQDSIDGAGYTELALLQTRQWIEVHVYTIL